MSEWETSKLHDWVAANDIELGRGNIISKDDINAFPGSYPIYSSSAHNNGKFGEYAKFMFDEELITWSVDGGGSLFYRPKHKFSVTNVCGYMRIKTADLHAPFIYYCLAEQHKHQSFDYTTKAHPSVIRKLYWLPKIDVQVQRKISRILQTIDQAIEKTEALIEKYQQIKAGLMHDLFTRGIGADGKLRPPREQAPELYQQTPIGWIPKEWEIRSLTSVATYQHGRPFPSADYTNEGVLLLRPGNLHISGYVLFDDAHSTRIPKFWEKTASDYIVTKGDILMNLTAQSLDDEFLGRVCLYDDAVRSLLNQRIARFKELSVEHEFLYWILRSRQFRKQIDKTSQGTKVQHLYNRDLDRVKLGVPIQSGEQIKIALRLNNVSEKIRAEMDSLQKLKKQKSGLMHDLLTGKVPVTP